ncbi:MAG: prephenate dehydratase [Gammaproteobacteria bacterium]|jgi:chorismate mutase / prephenate dehydratase|nr:prephenate dehydratase [Gammaproteobacteria bacterium]
MENKSDLEGIRLRIDAIDEQLLTLISERAALATDVAKLKKGESADTVFYRPEREAQVLRKIIANNKGPIADEEMARLFREFMSACLALEQHLNVAYLGPEATFTQSAALKHFGHSVITKAQISIAEVFREVESGACHYGVVPIENSIEGAVNYTLDLLVNSSLKICGEVHLRIHHNLMTKAKELQGIERVYSHQQSLAQCRSWLENNLPGAERIAVSSNAEAAKRALDDEAASAIAGEVAAERYQLPILAVNIEDEPDNTTRFLVLGRNNTQSSGNDKTSILFANSNEPGALQKSLACISDNNVNMSRIESRPSRQGMWEYVFFVDIDGHADDEIIATVLQQLDQHAKMMKVLGSYPCAVI